MAKSGLIMFILALVGTLIGGMVFCCCAPMLAVVLGAAAGYLAGVFDKPVSGGSAAGKGAGAGGIAGAGALIGQIIAAFINTAIIQQNPETSRELYEMLGIQDFNPEMFGTTSGIIATLFGGGCWGMLDILLLAGFGALGGYLWFALAGKKAAAGTPPAL
jgi:hypothetical protein